MTLSFMNNIGYIFIVRRLGKQSKLILSRLDSISNLELNLRYMAYVAQMLTQEPIYKPSSIFYFKPILLSAHKLILLIYGDNKSTALIPDVSNSMVILMDERMTLELGKFSGFSSFTLTMPCSPRERWVHIYRQPGAGSQGTC